MRYRFARRSFFALAGIFFLLPGLAGATPASDFVTSFGSELSRILNSPISLADKQKEILPLLQKNVDIAAIGRYCLGRYWKVATPEQQKKYLELFDQVLLYAVTSKIGAYQNVSLKITNDVASPSGEKIGLLISRPHQPDVNMTVVVDGNSPKVIDLFGEGASMRLTQRGDYTAYLTRHNGNVQTLINALQTQVNNNKN